MQLPLRENIIRAGSWMDEQLVDPRQVRDALQEPLRRGEHGCLPRAFSRPRRLPAPRGLMGHTDKRVVVAGAAGFIGINKSDCLRDALDWDTRHGVAWRQAS